MPGSADSLRITELYRRELLRIRQQAVAGVTAAWRLVDLQDLDGSFRRWLAAAAPLVRASKDEGARFAGAYVAAFASSELARHVNPVALDPDDYSAALDGRELAMALAPAVLTVKMARQRQLDDRQAVAMGIHRAVRTTSLEVVQTARVAQRDAMARTEQVVGWRRALSKSPCGACLGSATGEIHDAGELPHIHPHDRCVAEPVIRGVRDRVERPTGEKVWEALGAAAQAALFTGRGGEQKAELLRSGAVALEDLVTRSPMATIDDQITETPLASLA